jgi:site-specific DNA recombinase
MSTRCYAYIRTSTVKQGTLGVSLEAQRDAIEVYARRHDILIEEWFSETQTAAKRGRPIFMRMMKGLNKKRVDGLILHRIDRGSRNLKDWSDIADLTDLGLQVHFAHDALDLGTRGGRLAADVQAVVAADFIRNLRDETKKGMLGRFKQGYYPLGAPVGYLNRGRAQAKAIDPIRGPLVVRSFEMYATGKYPFHKLRKALFDVGFRTSQGQQLSLNGLTTMLRNPFYMGLMRMRSTGELFQGVHTPLISNLLFDQVQDVLNGKISHRGIKHDHLYRRSIVCKSCGYKLIGENQKGRVYYRCHITTCPKTSVREDRVTESLTRELSLLLDFFVAHPTIERLLRASLSLRRDSLEQMEHALREKRKALDARLSKLMDAVVDGLVDKEAYVERKNQVLRERQQIDEQIANCQMGDTPEARNVRTYLELMNALQDRTYQEIPAVAVQMAKRVTSNFVAQGKSIALQWVFPFDDVVSTLKMARCDPPRDAHRTFDSRVEEVVKLLTTPESSLTFPSPSNMNTLQTGVEHHES